MFSGSTIKVIPAVLAIVLILSYAAYASVSHKSASKHIAEASNTVSAQSDLEMLASDPGMKEHHFELKQPAKSADMTSKEAIDKAKTYIAGGYDSEHATGVHAVYALFTDNETPKLPEKDILLKDLPVWIVTIEGLKIEGHGGVAHSGTPVKAQPPLTQLHIVINDSTGEVLEMFSYK
ncbi:MAG: hypothetical protein AUK32_00330 [Candidatus Aquicultor secundus]|uniref:Uncharacterized protein n=1 Tax=Candidatus Aquicultor secundus TaxID=1973895 RepID=A0A2M7T872_9ACTN|nr:hypothetical protein [Candidatus Aquicultor secundus]NCO66128.1 hypothetical protein [Solirubrobacter sp.]OIO88866.1 MAG: hypothetical protein AUK32_00330 [Candidatus Aquicultor secundus]PIU26731.1 MAG: hypothetical protein COT10_07065 [Candidatus Aquicultor secundus]PIX52474.1 MAG: hypothetical protein COZ51_03880 [Candidatus Aquicultor secundus]PIY38495.1 MAG: hypothetical protein COZ03_08020 [Candidatus Aquicultor secundus]